ncbi:MAG: NifU family protein [Bernardetiaceae bacterium]
METTASPVHIYMEANPNPAALKFVFNTMLLTEGRVMDVPSRAEATGIPIAEAIFDAFPAVERVFFAQNFITITKSTTAAWEELRHEIRSFLLDYAQAGHPFFAEEPDHEEHEAQPKNPQEERIQQILSEYVRPAVEMDGGAITFGSFDPETGQLSVVLQGSCSGCPSSVITLKSGIENLFHQLMPEVKSVVAQEG